MQAELTDLPGVLILQPKFFGDSRGFFMESYSRRDFAAAAGLDPEFVQDNHSCSAQGVLRGIHYQVRQAQGKLVRVTRGEIYDVAVDLRRSSPYFGKWMAARLSAENRRMMWIPSGFGHGFLSLAEGSEVLYKTTDFHAPEHERCLAWNDPELAIDWPLPAAGPQLSARDQRGQSLREVEVFP
jgi:dTDP-4-dehydrorhamnose 3,5-epimerase